MKAPQKKKCPWDWKSTAIYTFFNKGCFGNWSLVIGNWINESHCNDLLRSYQQTIASYWAIARYPKQTSLNQVQWKLNVMNLYITKSSV